MERLLSGMAGGFAIAPVGGPLAISPVRVGSAKRGTPYRGTPPVIVSSVLADIRQRVCGEP